MRFVLAFAIALAAAGCGGDHCGVTSDTFGNDLAIPSGCHSTINEGETCDPACHYLGDHCSCSAAHVWTCEHPDMLMQD